MVEIDRVRCTTCGVCARVCPRACITVRGRNLTPEDVLSLSTEVGMLVIAGREKVRRFRSDMLRSAQQLRRFFSPPLLALMRLLLGRETHAMYRDFILPALDTFIAKEREGVATIISMP